MRILRDRQIISGFIYEEPVDEIPALTHCGEALCCRGHSRPVHTHPGFEFLYLTRGVCHWQAAGATFRQTMGDLFIAHPKEPHQTGPTPNPENRHLWLGLRLETLGPDGAALARHLRRHGIRFLPGCHSVEPILSAIVRQIMTTRPQRAKVVASLLHAFISLVSQRLAMAEAADAVTTDCPVLPYSFAVQKAITYMGKNLDRRISLRDLAMAATLRHPPHLCALFHREVGVTPALYHTQLRLQAARDALRQPLASITFVAMQFGFSSSQHFSTLFRRTFGLTPLKWKQGRRPEA
ncbi:hypothetical protein BH09VER1_BH09VER1_03580 [soil metagenome]